MAQEKKNFLETLKEADPKLAERIESMNADDHCGLFEINGKEFKCDKPSLLLRKKALSMLEQMQSKGLANTSIENKETENQLFSLVVYQGSQITKSQGFFDDIEMLELYMPLFLTVICWSAEPFLKGLSAD